MTTITAIAAPAPQEGHPCVECERPNAAHPDSPAETALCEGCLAGSIDFRMSQDGF